MPSKQASGTSRDASSSSPRTSKASPVNKPRFQATNETVAVASMQDAGATPRSASSPDGTSSESTGTPLALTVSISCAMPGFGGSQSPVPIKPSTMTSPTGSAPPDDSCMRTPAARAWMRAYSASSRGVPATATASTSRPRARARAPSSIASPPLLPFPASTTIRRADGHRRRNDANAAPAARRINSTPGIPAPSIAA